MAAHDARLIEILHRLAHPTDQDIHQAIDELADKKGKEADKDA